MLTVRDVTVRYGARAVVDRVSLSLREGQWLMLVGPNGAGKSTLLRAISRGVAYDGGIQLCGKDLRAFKPAELARMLGVLSQHNPVGYAYTVEEIVGLGRYAYAKGFLSSRRGEDAAHIEEALRLTGLTELRHASVLTLSGGELQRAFLAQVFAQDPRILMLDEPANHLDLVYQKQLFSLIGDWVRQPGRAVISVVHDLSLARKYGTHAALMHRGACVAQGATASVLSPERLRLVYDMDVFAWMTGLLAQWKA